MDEQEYQQKQQEYEQKRKEWKVKTDKFLELGDQIIACYDELLRPKRNPLQILLWIVQKREGNISKRIAALKTEQDALKPYVSNMHLLYLELLHLRYDLFEYRFGPLVPGETPLGSIIDARMEDGHMEKHILLWSFLDEDGQLFGWAGSIEKEEK